MTNATLADVNQVLDRRTEDDQILNGQAISICSPQFQGGTGADRADLTPSPSLDDDSTCTPHAEDTILLPIPASELTAAAARLRADPTLNKALTRLLDGGWSYQDEDDLIIRFEPRSRGRGKKRPNSYTTTDDSCTCPGAIIRGGCYHPCAWQIVSEALTPTTSIIYILHSTMVVPLCLLALAGGTDYVTVCADTGSESLTLLVPNTVMGTLTVAIDTPILLRIEQQVLASDLKRIVDVLTTTLPADGAQLTLDISAGSILVIAGSDDDPVLVDGLDMLPMERLIT